MSESKSDRLFMNLNLDVGLTNIRKFRSQYYRLPSVQEKRQSNDTETSQKHTSKNVKNEKNNNI